MKVISKFCPAGHLILIFIRRISPPKKKEKKKKKKDFQAVSNLSNKYEWGYKKISGGGGNLPWMMPCSPNPPQ